MAEPISIQSNITPLSVLAERHGMTPTGLETFLCRHSVKIITLGGERFARGDEVSGAFARARRPSRGPKLPPAA